MLIGLGDLGGVILEFLARERKLGRILVASRSEDKSLARCNLVRLGAASQGFEPVIKFVPVDLNRQESVTQTVLREAPDIILTTATMQTWWLPDKLPQPQAERIRQAGFGIWLPVHLTLTRKLMEALRDVSYQGIVLTAPYPDVVNRVLGCLGLAPTCGIGNIGEIVPKIQLLVAHLLRKPLASVKVTLVYHHSLHRFVLNRRAPDLSQDFPPFYLRVEHEGKDVTESVGADRLLFSAFAIPPGQVSHFLTAGSTMGLIEALCRDEETFTHAPGPEGLPGGYPVLVNRAGIRLAPIDGLRPEQAVGINETAQRYDGIDHIDADGTVSFEEGASRILKDTMGYDCRKLHPDEAEDRADELIRCFSEYALRYGVAI